MIKTQTETHTFMENTPTIFEFTNPLKMAKYTHLEKKGALPSKHSKARVQRFKARHKKKRK